MRTTALSRRFTVMAVLLGCAAWGGCTCPVAPSQADASKVAQTQGKSGWEEWFPSTPESTPKVDQTQPSKRGKVYEWNWNDAEIAGISIVRSTDIEIHDIGPMLKGSLRNSLQRVTFATERIVKGNAPTGVVIHEMTNSTNPDTSGHANWDFNRRYALAWDSEQRILGCFLYISDTECWEPSYYAADLKEENDALGKAYTRSPRGNRGFGPQTERTLSISMTTASPTQSKYLELSALAGLGHLRFTTKQQLEGAYSGRHRSRQQGGSGEFVDYRDYTPGEDLRRLDWKVLGRTGRTYIKQYQDETNLRCTLVADTSGSMAFGGIHRVGITKLEYLKYFMSALAYMVAAQQDQVGLALAGAKLDTYLEPGSTSQHLGGLYTAIEKSDARGESGLAGGAARFVWPREPARLPDLDERLPGG